MRSGTLLSSNNMETISSHNLMIFKKIIICKQYNPLREYKGYMRKHILQLFFQTRDLKIICSDIKHIWKLPLSDCLFGYRLINLRKLW